MHRLRLSHYGVAQLAFLAAWLVLAMPWLNGSSTIPYDAKAHFQAQIQFLANALHTGQSPAWTPHIFLGVPQIADPQSLIFSPAYLLAYFDAVPSFWLLDLYVFLLLGCAGLAVLKFFEDRQWHPAGAVLASVAIAFGSSAAWRIQHIGQIQSYAFFCVALWLLDRTLRRGSAAWGAAAVLWPVVIAAYFLAGQPGFYGDRLFVILKPQADVAFAAEITDYDERRQMVYTTLVEHADESQGQLRAALAGWGLRYTPYYLVNAVEVDGGLLARLLLAAQPEVDRILPSPRLRPLPGPLDPGAGTGLPAGHDWNLAQIHATRVWQELGVRGGGIVIGQSDSGVDGEHG